jgi:hypothetical protein
MPWAMPPDMNLCSTQKPATDAAGKGTGDRCWLPEPEFDKTRVFRWVGGAFIGTFNGQAGTEDVPVICLSAYLPSEAAATAALASGVWPRRTRGGVTLKEAYK